ncbi:MAG: hypothetical protein Q7J85_10675 [Bacillota bacterium]|nr:hypothetical protein [Bacillota bacterium]
MKEPHVKGIAEPSRPRVMRGQPRGRTRSVDRGKRRPAIELRNHLIWGADLVDWWGRQHDM